MGTSSSLRITYLVILFFCILWLILVFSPPFLMDGSRNARIAGGLVKLFFSPFCHQQPDRSFMIAGQPLAVCVRCTGIYTGFFLGVIGIPFFLNRVKKFNARTLFFVAMVPILIEFMFFRVRGIDIPAGLRSIIGLILGFAAALLVIPQLFKIIQSKQKRFIDGR